MTFTILIRVVWVLKNHPTGSQLLECINNCSNTIEHSATIDVHFDIIHQCLYFLNQYNHIIFKLDPNIKLVF